MQEVIVITGAASGIGKEIALNVSKPGVFVGLIDKNCSSLEEVAEACKEKKAVVERACLNVMNQARLATFLDEFVANYGKIGTVFVNAGLGPTQVTPDWHGATELMESNYFGALRTIESVRTANSKSNLPIQKLVIISSGSISSLVGTHSSGPYSASKAALKLYLDSLRLKTDKKDLLVVDVTIGFVLTPMTYKMEYLGRLIERDVSKIAMKIAQLRFKQKNKASIPYWRNSVWYLLHLIPTRVRDPILKCVYRALKIGT